MSAETAVLVAAFIAAIPAVFAVWATWRQGETDRRCLKYEVFEDRFALWKTCATLLDSISMDFKFTEEFKNELRVVGARAEFLVGGQARDAIEHAIAATQTMMLTASMLKDAGAGVDKSDILSERIKAFNELKDARAKLFESLCEKLDLSNL